MSRGSGFPSAPRSWFLHSPVILGLCDCPSTDPIPHVHRNTHKHETLGGPSLMGDTPLRVSCSPVTHQACSTPLCYPVMHAVLTRGGRT